MNEQRTTEERPSASEKPSPFEWMLGVIMDPRGAFEGIAESLRRPHPTDPSRTTDRSKWWVPVVVIIVVSAVVAGITVPRIVMPMQEDTIRESVLERGGTEEQADQAIEMSSRIGVPAGILGAAVQVFIMLFIFAGLLHLLMMMFGGKAGFGAARAVIAYSMIIPSVIGSLVKLPIMLSRETMFVETGPTVLPFFRDLEPSDQLYRFLFSGFDIFTIWWFLVIGVGVAVCYRVKAPKAAGAAIVLWAISTALFTLLNFGGAYGG